MKKILTLSIAVSTALLASEINIDKITIQGSAEDNKPTNAKSATVSDTATLLSDAPGVSMNTGGGFSSLPAIHGMADDRVKTEVDGMQITSACPNHMNPALSYVSAEKVSKIEAIAGITSVSEGGDSIGGTIVVKSKDPFFAPSGKTLATEFAASAFYRSNNHAQGIAVSATAATNKLSFNYSGSAEKAGNYYAGGNTKVADTVYQRQTQSITAGYKTENGILKFKLEQQMVPYEGFVNQYMDMNGNKSVYGNLSYNGKIGSATLDANAFKQQVSHYMNHILTERSGNMPMYTQSDEMGYNVKLSIPLSNEHILKVGTDLDKYKLNDWWPAVAGMTPGMAPDTFWNINNGHRDRLGIFAESNYQWSEKLATIFGLRSDIVSMNTDNISGYSPTNDNADATVFNSKDHAKTDYNFDITALVKYEPSRATDIEFGYARKTRSPNLYERYAWAGGYGNTFGHASIAMDMAMINWFGDGNGYVGNLDLKPEVAHTVSSTVAWHDEKSKSWNIKLTPYYTYVEDYIDVNYLGTATGTTTGNGYGGIRLFQFANHDAVLFGSDIAADANVWENGSFGKGVVKTVINYTRGYRVDGSGSSLYHMMPLNAKVSLEQTIGNWTNGLYVQGVMSKEQVDNNRKEPTTPGYGLVDIKTNYKYNKLISIDFAITNLFDKNYSLPLGGIDAIEKKANRTANTPLRGEGRSFNTALNVKF